MLQEQIQRLSERITQAEQAARDSSLEQNKIREELKVVEAQCVEEKRKAEKIKHAKLEVLYNTNIYDFVLDHSQSTLRLQVDSELVELRGTEIELKRNLESAVRSQR